MEKASHSPGRAAGGVPADQGRRSSRCRGGRKAIHAQRFLRSHTDAEGAWNLRMRDNPEVGAEIMAAIAPIRDRLFRQARAEGRDEPTEAYGADALTELARTGGTGKGPTGTVGGEGDRARRLGGAAAGLCDEARSVSWPGSGRWRYRPSETARHPGPVPGRGGDQGRGGGGVAHLGRRPTAHQQSALEWLYPTCAVEG